LNPVTNLLYVDDSENILVFDPYTNSTIAKIATNGTAGDIDFSTRTNELYVLIMGLIMSDNFMHSIL
jgi:DNA-binding beta-propeller fold protein YncE